MYIKTLSELRFTLNVWISNYEKNKKDFLEKLETGPVSALAWSESLHQHAARYELASYYIGMIAERDADIEKGERVVDEQEALNNIRLHALVRAVQGAAYSGSSSGALHNMSRRFETTAWAELAALFDRIERQVGAEPR